MTQDRPTPERSVVIHGHFYQPPRENPYFDVVESEPSASPYHDWNQRIERECYRAVVAARLVRQDGRIAGIMNTLQWISFNVGPTLLEWMEREARDTYEAILAADRASVVRLGHGNAIAQPYHHTILPLASRRDKETEVTWGIADFERRFRRRPEGMWLPETAVDDETLDVLAEHGIAFTILAPYQVARVPGFGRPGRYRTANGKTIAVCLYNGDLSHGIAFGGLLHDAANWVGRMEAIGHDLAHPPPDEPIEEDVRQEPGEQAPPHLAETSSLASAAERDEEPFVVSAATDGETFGHHHKFGEMALARALMGMGERGWRVENFASFLARHAELEPVDLVAPSAWSCAHGVGRWERDCGCRVDGARNPSQAWRTPLRRGLAQVADMLHAVYEREGTALFAEPWRTRDGYGAVVAAGAEAQKRFVQEQSGREEEVADVVRGRELLEMERDALRMFTSCAWFFDDIGGIEARQVLRYAARAIRLAGTEAHRLESVLLAELELAKSNDPRVGTGRDIYLNSVKPRVPPPVAAAASAIASPGSDSWPPTAPNEPETGVVVVEPRTGRAHEMRGRVLGASSTDIVTEVIDDAGVARTLHLNDLPERARLRIRTRLRRAILPQCLTKEELDLLVTGEATLAGLLRVGLLRAVQRLETDIADQSLRLVHELLDVFDQFEARVPFDAQTAFWRIWQSAPPSERARFAPILFRFGFAPEATAQP